jgi:general secretion pathway protein F
MVDTVGGVWGRAPVSLDELIALNEELVALTRAGMPLERGLVETGPDLPGRLRTITAELGQRLGQGESLPQALGSLRADVPPVYRAVVEAGLRAGKLPMALEGLTTYARGFAEGRQAIGLALWYPLIVLTVAYALFVFIVTTVIPRFLGLFQSLGVPAHAWLSALEWLGASARYWGPAVPVALAVFLVGWFASRRAFSLQRGKSVGGFLRWFPWMGSMMARFEAASFADLLSLLVEHRVPYPEALVLAGDASGDPALARSCRELSAALANGQSPSAALAGPSAFPPLLRWLIVTGPQQVDLAVALRQMAERYRAEARHQGEKIRVLLPTILLFGVGAGATLLYALAVFLPLSTLWEGLANPTLK